MWALFFLTDILPFNITPLELILITSLYLACYEHKTILVWIIYISDKKHTVPIIGQKIHNFNSEHKITYRVKINVKSAQAFKDSWKLVSLLCSARF